MVQLTSLNYQCYRENAVFNGEFLTNELEASAGDHRVPVTSSGPLSKLLFVSINEYYSLEEVFPPKTFPLGDEYDHRGPPQLLELRS